MYNSPPAVDPVATARDREAEGSDFFWEHYHKLGGRSGDAKVDGAKIDDAKIDDAEVDADADADADACDSPPAGDLPRYGMSNRDRVERHFPDARMVRPKKPVYHRSRRWM
jgi:hypothetical protein